MSWIATREPLSGSTTSMRWHVTVVAAAVSTSYRSGTTPPSGHSSAGCQVIDRRVENLQRLGHVHMPVCRDRLGCGVHQACVGGKAATETEEDLGLGIVRHTGTRRLSNRLDDLPVRLYGSGIVGVAGEGPASQVEHVVGVVSDPRRDECPRRNAS
jgi:hypothetical protein